MISQPRYLPALNYLQRMALCDVVIMLDTVQYTPRDWENRNRIKGPNGPVWLTVPVIHDAREQTVRATRIVPDSAWQKNHPATLQLHYRRSAHFQDLFDRLSAIYDDRWEYLSDLNEAFLRLLLERFEVRVPIVRASATPYAESRGQDLLISLCRAVGADGYVSGPLGHNYITPNAFEQAGIQLFFHDYVHPVYLQQHGDFVPFMSAVDLLFNCGPESAQIMQRGNVSREDLQCVAS